MSGRATRQAVSILTLLLAIAGCAWVGPSDAEQKTLLKAGTLQAGMRQQVVLDQWGLPSTVYVKSGKEMVGIGWNQASGGHSFRSGDVYEVWIYHPRKTAVAFRYKEIVAWRPVQPADAPKSK